MLTIIINWFRNGDARPNLFEIALLNEVEAILEPAMVARWRKRVAAINLVQRHGGGKEIQFYQRKNRAILFPDESSLFNHEECVDFAVVETRSQNHTPSRLRATISLFKGNMASIEFDRPSEHANLDEVEGFRAYLLGPPFPNSDAKDVSSDGWPAP
jgi:hypothetical protein